MSATIRIRNLRTGRMIGPPVRVNIDVKPFHRETESVRLLVAAILFAGIAVLSWVPKSLLLSPTGYVSELALRETTDVLDRTCPQPLAFVNGPVR